MDPKLAWLVFRCSVALLKYAIKIEMDFFVNDAVDMSS